MLVFFVFYELATIRVVDVFVTWVAFIAANLSEPSMLLSLRLLPLLPTFVSLALLLSVDLVPTSLHLTSLSFVDFNSYIVVLCCWFDCSLACAATNSYPSPCVATFQSLFQSFPYLSATTFGFGSSITVHTGILLIRATWYIWANCLIGILDSLGLYGYFQSLALFRIFIG